MHSIREYVTIMDMIIGYCKLKPSRTGLQIRKKELTMEQNRFKSSVFWSAVVAQIISIGQFTGIWAKYGIDAGMIGDVVAGVLQLAVLVGLLNNPTDPVKF